MKKPTFVELLFVIFLFCLVVFFAVTSFFDLGTAPLTLTNIGPCIEKDGKWILVKNLNTKEPQYICADMVAEESLVVLTLTVNQRVDSTSTVYEVDDHFEDGPIQFLITPSLPLGKYQAAITSIRSIFAEFNFEVTK